ncbi:MAG: class I tRNA ligase family protein, partial [Bacteroidota bacterium]
GALRLLHPLMPFVTEELWQNIRQRTPGETIMRSQLFKADDRMIDKQVEDEMGFVQSVIESVRNIRGEMSIAPSKEIALVMKLSPARHADRLKQYEGYLQRLARVTSLSFLRDGARPRLSASAVVQGEELFVPLEGLIDIEVEKTRLRKEIERLTGVLNGIRGKLNNESFVARAPKDVVEKEKEKQATFETNLEKLQKSYEALS